MLELRKCQPGDWINQKWTVSRKRDLSGESNPDRSPKRTASVIIHDTDISKTSPGDKLHTETKNSGESMEIESVSSSNRVNDLPDDFTVDDLDRLLALIEESDSNSKFGF